MNLMAQLLDAIVQSGDRDIHDNTDTEVLRLRELAIAEIVKSQFSDAESTDDDKRHYAVNVVILGQMQLYIKD
jgi:hypothetical protein